ncbi:MAG: bifunctional precorrin-2 dehydrogenase/sirohydrochlorin ferrochelatase [Bacteroidota bacterium]
MSTATDQGKNPLYPVFLKLEQLRVLVVGGGHVAQEKLTSLLSNSPATVITIVAPVIRDEVRELVSAHPACNILLRSFEETDLENVEIVICATDDKVLHKQIKEIANARKLLVNVADTPELCDFYLGSIVQKGNLKIAISTNGKSPTIAKRVKEVLQETIPEQIDSLLENMQGLRNKMSGDFSEKVKRLNELTKQLSLKQS